ncbi:E3 ubiquitin-protein ligase RNF25 [Synchiropus splendidus]|uniref:E3 ubiquitin-protein ligase RNF25 n=1 Tax=Synchiropus splendidus TaxID=270530 RepID=UPI00237E9E29|nr:E3 ubiquitin-protein ligase RNF25 [Synchiropus splendidus]
MATMKTLKAVITAARQQAALSAGNAKEVEANMAAESDIVSEIEVLQSIYLDELVVVRGADGSWGVRLDLYPSTAEDSVSQFVRLTLNLDLSQQYPWSPPRISIQNPRGLSDDMLSSVQTVLQQEAESSLGSPVLYQLIEKAKEFLTESNIPHGNCVICLYGFKQGESFTKTSCYHHFHSHCLGRYARFSESEMRRREKELQEDKTRETSQLQDLSVVCPVCRETLVYDVDQLLSSPPPQQQEADVPAMQSAFQQKWVELQKVLDRQRAKGGIIDPEEESNRFLIHINEAPAPTEDRDGYLTRIPSAPTTANDLPVQTERLAELFVSQLSHCREPRQEHSQSRGARREGRARPHRGRTHAARERCEKLDPASDGTMKTRHVTPGNSRHMIPDEAPERSSSGFQPSGLDSERLREPEDRGRRRGPHHPAPRPGIPGSAHWDGRAGKHRGGAGYFHRGRGGRGRGGGSQRGGVFHQRAAECDRVREELL